MNGAEHALPMGRASIGVVIYIAHYAAQVVLYLFLVALCSILSVIKIQWYQVRGVRYQQHRNVYDILLSPQPPADCLCFVSCRR
mgnify:FL=1